MMHNYIVGSHVVAHGFNGSAKTNCVCYVISELLYNECSLMGVLLSAQ